MTLVLAKRRTHALSNVFTLVARDALAHVPRRGPAAHHPRMCSSFVHTLLVFALSITRNNSCRRLGLRLRKRYGRHEDDSREHEAGCETFHWELPWLKEPTWRAAEGSMRTEVCSSDAINSLTRDTTDNRDCPREC